MNVEAEAIHLLSYFFDVMCRVLLNVEVEAIHLLSYILK